MKRTRLSFLLGLTVLSVLLAAIVALAPRTAEATLYSAGIERPATHICKCPVQVGDCVCEWTDP